MRLVLSLIVVAHLIQASESDTAAKPALNREQVVRDLQLATRWTYSRHVERARPVLSRALEVAHKHGFKEEEITALILIGTAHGVEGHYEDAVRTLLQAEALARDAGIALYWTRAISGVVAVYSRGGRTLEAEPWFQKGLELCNRPENRSDKRYMSALMNLAELPFVQRRLGAAETLYRRALAMADFTNDKHIGVIDGLDALGQILIEQVRGVEAAKVLRTALEMSNETLGPDDPITLSILMKIAITKAMNGKVKEGVHLARDARMKLEAATPKNGIEIGMAFYQEALVVMSARRFDEAEELLTRSLRIFDMFYPKGHPERVHSRRQVANLLTAMGRTKEAKRLIAEIAATQNSLIAKQ